MKNFKVTNILTEQYSKGTDAILLAHTLTGTVRGKSINGLLIHQNLFNIKAIVDNKAVGKLTSEICQGVNQNVPIYPNMEIAVHFHSSKVLIILSDPEEYWHSDIKMALSHNMDIINTTFKFVKNTPSVIALIGLYKVKYFDIRDVSEIKAYPNDKVLQRKSKVVLVTGTDCGLGKRTAAYELKKEAERRGLKAVMLSTGQTGLMLGEPGICIDGLTMEYSNGIISETIVQLSALKYDFIFVEGQADIFHPAYSPGTISLLHGSNPDCIILVHDDTRKTHKGFDETSELYIMPHFSRYIETFKLLSLPCGPEYNTIGIATIGKENIKNIQKQILNKDIIVGDVRTKEGPVLLMDRILEYTCFLHNEVFESINN